MISVVIASHNASAVILDCLGALTGQVDAPPSEIVVSDSSTDGTDELVRERFPDVRLLHFDTPLTVPHLRGAGIARTKGEFVAILDPYCIVGERWLADFEAAHRRRPEPVIGGAVELESAGRWDLPHWAAFLNEYAAFVPPMHVGETHELTGNNLVYKRSALPGNEELERDGFWKTFHNQKLLAEGHELWTEPSIVVRLRKPIPFGEFLRSRYHHGRCFGGMRVAGAPPYVRLLRAASGPLLPGLALWRQAKTFLSKGSHRARFLACAPLLLALHTVWACGEFVGSIRGSGKSCSLLFY